MKPTPLPTLKNEKNLRGKRVLVRVDLNVPVGTEGLVDTTRIEKIYPTLEYLKRMGAKTVLISHLGNGSVSLKQVARAIGQKFNLGFAPQLFGRATERMIEELPLGGMLLLENLRGNEGELKNNTFFAISLAKYGDLFVNEAFSTSHREHASIVSLPKFLPSVVGLRFEEEIRELSKLADPKQPFLFILGGAKMETKFPILAKYLKKADAVFVGGALMNSFFRAQGFEIGRSIVDDAGADIDGLLKSKRLLLPHDVVVENGKVRGVGEVGKREAIRDIGPETLTALKKFIGEAKTVLFNGPLGDYEKGFDRSTLEVLRAMAASKAHTVIGGGDTMALYARAKIRKGIDFVSTGGGAMIEFLVTGTLPGIKAIRARKK